MENRSAEGSDFIVYVGTRKLVVLKTEPSTKGPRIAGFAGRRNPEGFERGYVTHLEKAATTIQELIDGLQGGKAEECNAYVVLGNAKLKTFTFSSSHYYGAGARTITPHEIRSVVSQTRSVATLPLSESILQAVPESFLVNDLAGIRDPLGLEATRLGVTLKIFTMDYQDLKNIANAFESAEVQIKGFFSKHQTLPEAVLTDREREDGALIVDIADDATHFMLWKENRLVATRVAGAGSRVLSEQIGAEWGIDWRDGEKVKEQFGALESKIPFGDELIPLVERNGKGACSIHRKEFQEKFSGMARKWLGKTLEDAAAFARDEKVAYPHYVFTGGGTRLEGFYEFVQKNFSCEGRIAQAKGVEAPTELMADPAHAAELGLCRWLAQHGRSQHRLLAPTGVFQKTLASAKDWLSAYF